MSNMNAALGNTPFKLTQGAITVELMEPQYWSVFAGLPVEMIACRKGRNLFPYLVFRLTGLDPNQMYYIFLEFRRHGDKRFCYDPCAHKWSMALEEEDLPKNECIYESDISPKMGSALNGKEISFKHVKLVNTKQDRSEQQGQSRPISDPMMFVHTKCFYRPYLVVRTGNGPMSRGNVVLECHFPLTQFVTVTAYRNDQITQLKIDHNPKARAFKIKKDRKTERGETNKEHEVDNTPSMPGMSYDDAMASAAEFLYSPQDMFGYQPHYGYHQAAATPMEQQQQQMQQQQQQQMQQMQQQQQMQQMQQQQQDVNNQNAFFNPTPMDYNNLDGNNLLPVATQQLHHPNYAAVDMQSYVSAMPTATNGGDVSGPHYVGAPQQYTGVAAAAPTGNQQQFPVQTAAPAADINQLNNVYNAAAAAAECYPAQPNTVGHQFAQVETPMVVDTAGGAPEQQGWDGQQQAYYNQQFYGGYDPAAAGGPNQGQQ